MYQSGMRLLINNKRSIVLVSVPIDDMVSKCLGREVKIKKPKIEAMIDADEKTWHWMAQVAIYQLIRMSRIKKLQN